MNEEDARTYIEIGICPNEIVKLRWPDITDGEANHMLWEHTAFPLESGILDIVDMVADLPYGCGCH